MARRSKRKRSRLPASQVLSPATRELSDDGTTAYARGELAKARLAMERVLVAAPAHVPTLLTLAQIARDEVRLTDAIRYLKTVATVDPQHGQALAELGRLLYQQNEVSQALDMLRRAHRLGDRSAALMSSLPGALMSMGQHEAGLKIASESAQTHPDDHRLHSSRLLALNYTNLRSAESVARAHREWGNRCADDIAGYPPPTDAEAFGLEIRPKRLRLGIVSADLRQHSVSYFATPLLANLDRERFEVVVYHTHPNRDDTTVRLISSADRWHNVAELADRELLRCIRADGIHLLLDLNGHTAYNRLPVFAARAAPVQLTYAGYPNTTGLEAMDYRVVDCITDPASENDEEHYTETLVRLPETFLCYAPGSGRPSRRVREQSGWLTFGCFNNPQKITGDVLATWLEILRTVQRSRLLLKSRVSGDRGYVTRTTRYFTERGISQKRLEFRPYATSAADGMAVYQHVDIALDTFPYNGTTTSCEAMWMGVPVITLRGAAHAGRVGASLLCAAGLSELVAEDRAGYVDAAVTLASDADRLYRLSAGLRDQMQQSALMNAPAFARRFESALDHVWERFLDASRTSATGPPIPR
ncbi:MAG: tetratricopeptide repeat protein [Pseudomonadota bacterium]